MEKLLKDIKYLLVCIWVLLLIIAGCQIYLLNEKIKPPRAEAKIESIQRVDLVKIGGWSVSKTDFVREKK